MENQFSRRNFLKKSATADLGIALGSALIPVMAKSPLLVEAPTFQTPKPLKTVRMGFIGHGGMDFIEDYRLINALLKGIEPDMDVYDAAALSVVTELSELSIAANGRPIEFPDFTRGRWKTYRELPVMLG